MPEDSLKRGQAAEVPTATGGCEATVRGIRIRWDPGQGSCTFEALPVAMMWVDSTLAGLMSGVQSMVGTPRFCLALQAGGRDSVDADWRVISQFPDFRQGFAAIANIAAVAGWGQWELTTLDLDAKECRFRVRNSWEGQYQKALGVCWGSAMMAGKFAGYCSRLFATNCWADQTAFLCKGDEWDEFRVHPSTRSIEQEIENLLATDAATRADLAVAVMRLKKDIAERQRTEETLRQMSQAVEQSPAAVVVTDLDGNITYVNPKFAEMTGYTAQEVLGKNPRILKSGDTPTEVYEGLWRTITAGRTWRGEWWNRRKDGQSYLEQAAISPIVDPQGHITHYVAVKEDVTEQWQNQQALRESQERFRALVESTSDWIWEVDAQGKYTYVSPRVEPLLGYQPHELLGKSPFDLMPPDEARRLREVFRALAAERKPFANLVNTNVHRNGQPVVLETSGVPILDAQGNLAGYRGIDRDITERKRAEESLNEARQLYESIFQGSPAAIVLTTEAEGRYLMVSPAHERLTGYRADEVLGHTTVELQIWEGAEDRRRFIQRLKQQGAIFNAEVVFRRKSGERFPVLLSAMQIMAGGQRCLVGLATDITERKQAEESLRQSELRFRRLMEQAPVAVSISRAGRTLYVNDKFLRLFGFQSLDEVVGQPIFIHWTPQSQEMIRDYAQRRARGEPVPTEYEATGQRKDGSCFPADIVVDTVGLPDGPAFIAFVSDVTERKRAQEKLRDSQERLALALSAGQLATWDWRMDTGEVAWNDEHFRMLGYAPGDVKPSFQAWLERVHPDDQAAMEALFARALETGGDYAGEFRVRWLNGTIRWIEARGHIVRDAAGQASRSYGVLIDTTDRRAAEEALRQFNAELEQRVAARTAELEQRARQLSRLASELTLAEQRERQRLARLLHDHLQQLLVGVKFGLETVTRRADQEQRSSIDQIQGLLDESIKVSRELTADLSPPILKEAGLAPGLEWLARWMQDKHGLVVDLAVDPSASPEREDVRVLLFQSVRELLFNVVKHAGVTAAHVELSRQDADNIQVVVRDDGVGIGNAEGAAQPAGNLLAGGFGLFSIRERLHLLGGCMDIHTAANQGTRITLVAPCRLPGPAAQEQAAPPRPLSAPGGVETVEPAERPTSGRIGILLVDDHVVMRQGLSALLAAEADLAVIGQASDGQEAVELAGRLHPEVILMDSSMPGMDGVEATRIIHAEQPDIRIIGLSMYDQADRAAAMIEAGAIAYLTKSGSPDLLLAAIRQHKEQRV